MRYPTNEPDGKGRISLNGRRFLPLTTEQQRTVEQNQGMIWTYLKAHQRPWAMVYYSRFGHDEWESMAQAVLCSAVIKHDPGKGALSTIFHHMLRQTACKEITRSMRSREYQSIPVMDENGADLPFAGLSNLTVNDPDPDLAGVVDLVRRRLSPREQHVILCRFWRDRTLAETGRRIGLSKEMTRHIEKAALAKLRAAYEPAGH